MYGNILYVVIPCYNEEEVLPETARRLKDKMEDLNKKKNDFGGKQGYIR